MQLVLKEGVLSSICLRLWCKIKQTKPAALLHSVTSIKMKALFVSNEKKTLIPVCSPLPSLYKCVCELAVCRLAHMIPSVPYTCLSLLRVTSHVHCRCSSYPRLPLWRYIFQWFRRYHPCLVTVPHALPHPSWFPDPVAHPTHHPPCSLSLYSAFIFLSSLPASLLLPGHFFFTSSESHTSWMIYLCATVGNFAVFPVRLLLKGRWAAFSEMCSYCKHDRSRHLTSSPTAGGLLTGQH